MPFIDRTVLGTSAVLATLALGACLLRGSPVLRNPHFTAAKAPPPTAAMEVVTCQTLHGTAAGVAAAQVAPLYADRVRVRLTVAGDDLRRAICRHIREGEGGRTGDPFAIAPSFALVVRKTVEELSAQSLFVPVVSVTRICQNRVDQVTDEYGAVVGRVTSSQQDCGESRLLNIHGLLFSSSGDLLWSGMPDRAVRWKNPGEVDAAFLEVVAQVPADFADVSAAGPPGATAVPPPGEAD